MQATQAEVKSATSQPARPAAASHRPERVLQRCSCGGSGGECAACRAKRLQRHSAGPRAPEAVPASVEDVLRSPGQPLDPATSRLMGTRFGHDFGRVRIHTDSRAAASAGAVSALAYTVGQDVVFGPGQYAPSTGPGLKLLAHELTHVVQQQGAGGGEIRMGAADDHWEREAAAAADSVAAGEGASAAVAAAPLTLQRQAVTTEPAGGCGICMGPRSAGSTAHTLIQEEFQISLPFMLPEFPFASPTDDPAHPEDGGNGRLDLVLPVPTGLQIGEIKPANLTGYANGASDITFYKKALELLYPKSTIELLKLPLPAIIPFVDPQAPKCQQELHVNPPVGGVYGYWCTPPFSQLKARKECKCGGDDEGEPVKVPVPDPKSTALFLMLLAMLWAGLKQGGKKALPAYRYAAAAAILILLASGKAEAKPGPGEDPLETLFKAMEQQGTPVPPAVKQLLDKDPELKKLVEESAKGKNLSAGAEAMNRKMLQEVNDNIDQYSKEDLEALLTVSEASGGVLPDSQVTTQRIKHALQAAKGRAGAGTAIDKVTDEALRKDLQAKAGAQGKSGQAGTQTTPTSPSAPGSKPSGIDAQLWQQLQQRSANVRLLFQMITEQGGTGAAGAAAGPVVTNDGLRRFLAIAPDDITGEDLRKLAPRLANAQGQTETKVLDSLSDGIAALRPASGAGQGAAAGTGDPDWAGKVRRKLQEFKGWDKVKKNGFVVNLTGEGTYSTQLYGRDAEGKKFGATVTVTVTKAKGSANLTGVIDNSTDSVWLDSEQVTTSTLKGKSFTQS